MAELRSVLTLEQDGSPLPDFPAVLRFIFAETSGVVNLSYAPDNNTSSFHPVVQASMAALEYLYIATDQPINVILNNSATSFPMQAGSALLLAGTQLQQGTPSNNVQINNPATTASGTIAHVTLVLAGT